jgi:hypothetical protein
MSVGGKLDRDAILEPAAANWRQFHIAGLPGARCTTRTLRHRATRARPSRLSSLVTRYRICSTCCRVSYSVAMLARTAGTAIGYAL